MRYPDLIIGVDVETYADIQPCCEFCSMNTGVVNSPTCCDQSSDCCASIEVPGFRKLLTDEVVNVIPAPVKTNHYLSFGCAEVRVFDTTALNDDGGSYQPGDVYDRLTFTNPEQLWEMASILNQRYEVVLVAHNAAYDLLTLSGLEYGEWSEHVICDVANSMFGRPGPFRVRLRNRLKTNVKPKPRMYFTDSTNWFKMKLADYRGDKLDFDVRRITGPLDTLDKATQEEAVKYCQKDAEITADMLIDWWTSMRNYGILTPGPSISSDAYKLVHRHIRDQGIELARPIYKHPTTGEMTQAKYMLRAKDAYIGGRTEAWYIGEPEERSYALDFSSLYPAASCYDVPYEIVGAIRKSTDLSDLPGMTFLADVTITTEVPLFPVRIGNEVHYPVGTFRTWLWKPLYEQVEKYGGTIDEVHGGDIYLAGPILRDFVHQHYEAKQNADLHLNRCKVEGCARCLEARKERQDVKSLLNHFYGRFAIRKYISAKEANCMIFDMSNKGCQCQHEGPEATCFGWILNGDWATKEIDPRDPNNTILKYDIDGKVYWMPDQSELEPFGEGNYMPLASFITAQSKAMLNEALMTAGLENVRYMDTDSVHVNAEGRDRLIESGLVGDSELGKLTVEDKNMPVGGHGYYAPKMYYYDSDKVVFKGAKIGDASVQLLVGEDGRILVTQQTRFHASMSAGRGDRPSNPVIDLNVHKYLTGLNRRRRPICGATPGYPCPEDHPRMPSGMQCWGQSSPLHILEAESLEEVRHG